LKSLYTMLEFCEEPFICRRKMQIEYLGERFDEALCNKMCDNCKKGYKISEKVMNAEAKTILNLV